MAEIASQGRVGSQGGGEATVFDTSAFYNQMYNIQRDVAAKQEQKKKEYEKQQATWNALLEDPGDVWQSDYEYVNKAVTEYNDFIIDLKSKGLDPETLDSSLMRKMKQLETNIRKTTSAAKDNETYSVQSFGILNQDKAGKYNKEYAAKWLQEYADPKKSPQDRAKMRNESNPFKLNYNIIDFVDKTIPEPSKDDSGRRSVTYRDENAHKSIVLSYIKNDPMGAEVFESLKEPGETEIAFAERIAKLGQEKYQPQTDVQPAPQPRETKGDDFKGGYGTGNWNNKLYMAYNTDPQYAPGKKNKITITRGGTNDNLPFINVLDDNRKLISFQPSSFLLRDDGKISVEGYEDVGKGKTKKVFVSYDQNKDTFKSQAMGYDVQEDFNQINGSGTATQVPSSTTESATYTGVPTGGF